MESNQIAVESNQANWANYEMHDLKQLKRQTMANQCTYTERDVEMYHVFGTIRKTFPAQ